jgi:SAM-dependent methyltransferase
MDGATARLTPADFARAFGVSEADLPASTRALAAAGPFAYRRLSRDERDRVILGVLDRIEGGFQQVGAHRDGIWESAWSETAARFRSSGHDLAALEPTFIGASPIVRLHGDYAEAADPRFELAAFEVFRDWMFRTFLGDCDRLLEFGCGSGFNLAAFARAFPAKAAVGLDWAPAAVALVDEIAAKHGFRLTGRRFDFFAPDPDLALGPGDAVATFCALEQVGPRFGPFLDFLLERRPRLCVHMEPTLEHYDPDRLPDRLAIRYHRHRDYLDGFLTRLRALEAEGLIRLLDVRRLGWGSLYHECHSFTAWTPA